MITCIQYYDNRIKKFDTLEEVAEFLCMGPNEFIHMMSSPFPCNAAGWIVIPSAKEINYDSVQELYARWRGLIYYYKDDLVLIAPTPEILADNIWRSGQTATLTEIKYCLRRREYVLNGGLLHYGGDRSNTLRLLRKSEYKNRHTTTVLCSDYNDHTVIGAADISGYTLTHQIPIVDDGRVKICHKIKCSVCGYSVIEINRLDNKHPSAPAQCLLYCSNNDCVNHTAQSLHIAKRSWAIHQDSLKKPKGGSE